MDWLSISLLVPEIYYNMNQKNKAITTLEYLLKKVNDPWFRSICEFLSSKRSEQSLLMEIGDRPENFLTAHTALGFWAEGSGDKDKAIRHYKEVLGSYMDERIEYEFAIARILRLKK
jgi:tetratricopeptide (TPR) repeat protein